jgi:uncharacterized protein
MNPHTIEDWNHTQAELEIRRWLIAQHLWAPEAERAPSAAADAGGPAIGTLNDVQIEELLRAETVGRIGCHAEGKTYVVPISYVYHDRAVYGHTAPGLKLTMLSHNPAVCFEVDQVSDVTTWRSVIGWGRFDVLDGAAAEDAMRRLIDRLKPTLAGPPHGTRPGSATDTDRAAVTFRIGLDEWSGRFQQRMPAPGPAI